MQLEWRPEEKEVMFIEVFSWTTSRLEGQWVPSNSRVRALKIPCLQLLIVGHAAVSVTLLYSVEYLFLDLSCFFLSLSLCVHACVCACSHICLCVEMLASVYMYVEARCWHLVSPSVRTHLSFEMGSLTGSRACQSNQTAWAAMQRLLSCPPCEGF